MGLLDKEKLISSRNILARNMTLRDDGRPYCMGSYINKNNDVTPCDINMPGPPFNFAETFAKKYKELSSKTQQNVDDDSIFGSIMGTIENGIDTIETGLTAAWQAEKAKLNEWENANNINIDDYGLQGTDNKCKEMLERENNDSQYFSLCYDSYCTSSPTGEILNVDGSIGIINDNINVETAMECHRYTSSPSPSSPCNSNPNCVWLF